MSDKLIQNSETPQVAQAVQGVGRRRLLRAGLAAAPVLMAVSGRSAMATGVCAKGLSPLAWNSLAPNKTNCIVPSHNVGTNSLGFKPDTWKPKTGGSVGNAFATSGAWVELCVPFDGYVVGTAYNNILSTDAMWATGTKFNQIFGSGSALSCSRILLDTPTSIEAHLVSAFLNSIRINGYALKNREVLDLKVGKVGNVSGFTNAQLITFLTQTYV